MINEMLFEHEAPAFDDIEQSLLEWSGIDTEPQLKDVGALQTFHLFIDLFICVDLRTNLENFNINLSEWLECVMVNEEQSSWNSSVNKCR